MKNLPRALDVVLGTPLGWLNRRVVPAWDVDWWLHDASFELSGRRFEYFYHRKNCGWPTARMTERSVELALADQWLDRVPQDGLFEVGAVTPYYWPRRVKDIIDPFDPHPLVTIRRSFLDLETGGAALISLSTFEHIGSGEYEQDEDPDLVIEAFRRCFAGFASFLITVPLGYNRRMDQYLLDDPATPTGTTVRFLARPAAGNRWREVSRPSPGRFDYGGRACGDGAWANAIAVVERGGLV